MTTPASLADMVKRMDDGPYRGREDHRAVSLIVLTFLLLILAALVQPLFAQQREVELSQQVSRALVDYWQRPAADSTTCLLGHWRGGVVVVDSATALSRDCSGYFGAIGFLHGLPDSLVATVMYSLMLTLATRNSLDWQFIAEVRGVGPTLTSSGRHLPGPILIYAWRRITTGPPKTEGQL